MLRSFGFFQKNQAPNVLNYKGCLKMGYSYRGWTNFSMGGVPIIYFPGSPQKKVSRGVTQKIKNKFMK